MPAIREILLPLRRFSAVPKGTWGVFATPPGTDVPVYSLPSLPGLVSSVFLCDLCGEKGFSVTCRILLISIFVDQC